MTDVSFNTKLISIFINHEFKWCKKKGFPNKGETLVIPNTIYTDLKEPNGSIVYGHPDTFKRHDDEPSYGSDGSYYGEALRRLEYHSGKGNIILEFNTGADMFQEALKYVLRSKIGYVETHVPEVLISTVTEFQDTLSDSSVKFLQQAITYCEKHTKDLHKLKRTVELEVTGVRAGLEVNTNLRHILTSYINDILRIAYGNQMYSKGLLGARLWKIAKSVCEFPRDS